MNLSVISLLNGLNGNNNKMMGFSLQIFMVGYDVFGIKSQTNF